MVLKDVFVASKLIHAVRLDLINGAARLALNVEKLMDNVMHHITVKIKKLNAMKIQKNPAAVMVQVDVFAASKLKLAVKQAQTNGVARQAQNVERLITNVIHLTTVMITRQNVTLIQKKRAAAMVLMDAFAATKLIHAAKEQQINGVARQELNVERLMDNVTLHTIAKMEKQNVTLT